MKVSTLKIISTALTISEASQIVRNMKNPGEITERMARLKFNLSKTKNDKYKILGDLITELFFIFPNSLPKHVFIKQAIDLGLEEEFIDKIIEHLHFKGLVLLDKDFRNNVTLKFPNLPFYDKISVSKPLPKTEFRKLKWK